MRQISAGLASLGILLTASAPTLVAQEKKEGGAPAARYSALVKEYERALPGYLKRLQGATSVADQGRIFREEHPAPAIARQFVELARAHPKDPAAYDGLVWVVETSEFGLAAEKPYNEAIKLLSTTFADHKDNEKLFERMSVSPFVSSGQFLQAVFEKHPSAIVRGRAGFHWALFLKNYCATVENFRSRPDWAKNVELFVGPELVQPLSKTDTAKMLREAESVFERVRKDYPLFAYKKTNLGKAADAELFEMRHLSVGKTVPEIEGEDTAGNKLTLSEYRGKVVVVVFWGTWCPHCMAMVPQERALVKRYEGKPFAIVGINSDIDRDKVKPALAKHGITWRSFWDGPTAEGPIASRWNVQGWPAVYVLDAKGVIRFKNVRDEYLNRAVEELMKEAAK